MNDQDFWTEMRADPDSDLPGLAYADWLDEQGDERGLFVRASLKAAHYRPGEPGHLLAHAEEHQTFQQHGGEWRDRLEDVQHYELHRGMLRPTMSLADVLALDVLETLPVDGVHLNDSRCSRGTPLDDRLRRVSWLSLAADTNRHHASTFRTLGHPVFSGIRVLRVHRDLINSPDRLRQLLDLSFPCLTELHITGPNLPDSLLKMLCEWEPLRFGVRVLTAAGLRAGMLARTGRTFESLMRIDTHLPPAGMFAHERFPKLTNLDIPAQTPSGSEAVRVAEDVPHLRELACGPKTYPTPERCTLPNSLRHVTLRWPKREQVVPEMIMLLESIADRLEHLHLIGNSESAIPLSEAVANLIGEELSLMSLNLPGDMAHIARHLFGRPNRFRSLEQLGVVLDPLNGGTRLMRAIADHDFPALQELIVEWWAYGPTGDPTGIQTFFRSGLPQRVRSLRLSFLNSEPLLEFLRVVEQTGFPNLEVLTFGRLPYDTTGVVPLRQGLPALRYLAFQEQHTVDLERCFQEFGLVFDPRPLLHRDRR